MKAEINGIKLEGTPEEIGNAVNLIFPIIHIHNPDRYSFGFYMGEADCYK